MCLKRSNPSFSDFLSVSRITFPTFETMWLLGPKPFTLIHVVLLVGLDLSVHARPTADLTPLPPDLAVPQNSSLLLKLHAG